jgi:hypothetical protein
MEHWMKIYTICPKQGVTLNSLDKTVTDYCKCHFNVARVRLQRIWKQGVCVNDLLSNEYNDSENVFFWKLRGLVNTEHDAYVDGVQLNNNVQTKYVRQIKLSLPICIKTRLSLYNINWIRSSLSSKEVVEAPLNPKIWRSTQSVQSRGWLWIRLIKLWRMNNFLKHRT